MHKLAEKIADCLKAKVEAKGIDNIEGQDLAELGMWTDIIKDLVCYDKDKKIIEAMDEAEESEEAMKYIEMYEDYPERKGYRGQPRDSRGRYMSRRGYESRMMPEMRWDDMEYERDMDRPYGRMGYSGSNTTNSSSMGGSSSSGMSSGSMGSQGGSRGYSDGGRGQSSRSESARRGYEESKMMQDGSPESKKKSMESLESYLKELSEDMTDLVSKMDANEKSMVKNKLQVLAQKVS